jgi:hypothetical protein
MPQDSPSAATPEAYAPAATTATQTPCAPAAAMREPVTAAGLCSWTVNLSKIRVGV